ncbi:serine--tRNA ligase [Granulicella sp. 5B5]|uniref:serine--tRNA ligase n=1 Tax=Granulicella sp. 5B5 TaxID=1617967 RepID=UPI0015F599BB|nr:serine--tRNA ligase [Granulicella sp. 5B5]QMV17307.1 serine--tRNA ligase [Granulicella sp. 5B5]
MLDLGFVRANLPLVEEKLRLRGVDPGLLAGFATLDAERRAAITEVETLKAQRNALSAEFGRLKREGGDVAAVSAQVGALKEKTEALEATAATADEKLRTLMESVPNLPHESVPAGKSEHDNRCEKTWGEPAKFDFEAKDHVALGEALGIVDFERGAKISGSRFVVHFGAGARLERALANFMLDLHTREHGYAEVLPPFMVNSKSLFGTGQLPKFAEDLFHCDDKGPYVPGELQENDHWMIPTAEVPVTNIFRDETIDLSNGTISFVAYTPCFRSEAGSYGKDVRGMIRQHQFQKVELVKFTTPEESYAEHENLTRNAETVLEMLGLPYRRMLLCTGDMGFSSAKTYDLEVWLPGQQTYREISSCSNFEAFQARRANIRYKAAGAKKAEFVHTLNGSGLAVGRTYLAILENYQQADGSVKVPEALVPYMGGERVITKQAFGRVPQAASRDLASKEGAQ